MVKLCTKFECNRAICGGVIAVWIFDLMTLNMYGTWGIMWSIYVPNLSEIDQFAAELWMINEIFRTFLGGAPIQTWVFWKMRGPICTKFGGDTVRSLLHRKFKNGEVKLKAFWLMSGCLITTIQFSQITTSSQQHVSNC